MAPILYVKISDHLHQVYVHRNFSKTDQRIIGVLLSDLPIDFGQGKIYFFLKVIKSNDLCCTFVDGYWGNKSQNECWYDTLTR